MATPLSIQGTSVSGEQRGYGRGLILGLTMAESMLLLVFCLLLAAGAIVMREKAATEQAKVDKLAVEQELEAQKDANALLAEKLEVFRKAVTDRDALEKEWRELELAKASLAEILKTGLTLEEVKKQAPILRELKAREVTIEEVRTGAETLFKLQEQDITAKDFEVLAPVAKELLEQGLTAEDIEKLAPAIKVLRDQVVVSAAEKKPEDQLLEMVRKAQAADGEAKPHEWPPIINLSETNGYFFRSGSAELSPAFLASLQGKTAEQIADIAARYDVDVIEVIGHTDEQKISGIESNMDGALQGVLSGTTPVKTLRPADNAGLGLARAIAVAEILKDVPGLDGLTVLPMSGAQLILPDDTLTNGAQAGDVASRRRIEIRVRKRNGTAVATDAATAED
ncbi:hypothetical protein [Mesorhizobium sp. CAU 1732]|uniref:hypothetical protein n=1 Tax=Mesorhizobium sp. CAU 1732 TaxID=3140358 RepID=UPI0032608FAA